MSNIGLGMGDPRAGRPPAPGEREEPQGSFLADYDEAEYDEPGHGERGYDDPDSYRTDPDGSGRGRGGRRRSRSGGGCLKVGLVFAVVLGLIVAGGFVGYRELKERFADPEDYPGPGTGEVSFEVKQGDTITAMGRGLRELDVVASVDAFIEEANTDPDAASIQVGFYPMREQMSAADALAVLTDPANIVKNAVTIPEGLRVSDVTRVLAESTDFSRRQFNRALRQTEALGLPDYAEGNPEGYLFPATYDFGPNAKPIDMLKAMVDRWRQAAEEANLEGAAEDLGKTPAELMIIASLIEAEGRGADMPKISRVIYNRLDGPGDKGGTNGRLGIDAAIAYGLGLSPGSTELTPEQLAEDTPYNTRIREGLPPTPIEAPGDEAIAAAANPAEGGWYYYVTVDLSTGETRFYEDYDGFLEGRALYKQYCETSDRC